MTDITASQRLRRPAIAVGLAIAFTAIIVASGGIAPRLAGPSATLNGIGEEKGVFGILAEMPSMALDAIVGIVIAGFFTYLLPWLGRSILKAAGRQ